MVADTLQLDLDVVLPHAHDAKDRCVTDLVVVLSRIDGVESVHVISGNGESPDKVCLHVQSGSVSMAKLRQRVRSVGAVVGQQYGHLLIEGGPAGHASRARSLGSRLRQIDGVVDGVVSVEGITRVEYDKHKITEPELLERLASLGISHEARGHAARVLAISEDHDHSTPDDPHAHSHSHEHGHGASRIELFAALVSLVIYVVTRSLDWFSDLQDPVTYGYIAAALITGVFVARDAWSSVRARVFDIDQLMLVAAIGAALIGHWSDSALLLVLFSLGHALEGYAMNRARTAIESLGELAPAKARRVEDPDTPVRVEELLVGDIVVVKPNERLPADGVVTKGETSVDESAVTGESVPVDKSPVADPSVVLASPEDVPHQSRVFAGTLNGQGAVEVMVLKASADSTLARVVELVTEAETQISPTQRLTNRIVRVFVPSVLALVTFLLVVPPLTGEVFSESFARAMAVLVAASPCALAIATPSAVLAAIARAAKDGILVKGGGPLEALGAVKAIAFDKTGTLTEGKPELTDIEPVAGVSADTLLQAAYAVEQLSDHPIAVAITDGAKKALDTQVSAAVDVRTVTGMGITGNVADRLVMIGNAAMFGDVGLPAEIETTQETLEAAGRTTMIVKSGDQFLGVIGVMDTLRPDAIATVAKLRDLGIETVVMLSGDNQRVASAIGEQVGIDDARGGLLPADKVGAIDELSKVSGVAMIGDGVNDAPALAAANVGIAMGAAGSDVALETADVALMADQLNRLPSAVAIARRASRTIRQNMFFSLGVVAVLIPLTIVGVGISAAVIAHEGSTLVVVANALLLLNRKQI